MSSKAHNIIGYGMYVEKKEEARKLMHGPGQSSYMEGSSRERDFSFLISSYSIVTEMSEFPYSSIDHFPPFIRRLVPEDIVNKIRKGESYIFKGEQVLEDLVGPPDPILNLATDLAIEQLIQLIQITRYELDTCKVSMTTRNNVEKRAVVAKIEAALNKEDNMFGSRKIFNGRVISVDLSKCKSDEEVEPEIHKAAEQELRPRWRLEFFFTCVLLIDGDGDQNINPWKVGHPIFERDVVVFITTESAAVRRREYVARASYEVEIRTEDHLLPWVLFCRNVGSDLLRSSNGIQRIAVQIVEECGGHLHVIVMVAKLLKKVQDVEIWEHTLQKLRSTFPEVKYMEGRSRVFVNAFLIFWESLDPIKKDCLRICSIVFGKYGRIVYASD